MLILLIIFPLLPKEGFATKFTHNPNDKTVQDLIDMNYPEFNINRLPINPYVYKTYTIVVWGDWSDTGDYEKKDGEYRYLGQDYNGDDVTNDRFPNDATSEVPLPDKNWQMINEKLEGWMTLSPIQIDHILNSKKIKNDDSRSKIKYSISEILSKVRGDKRKYIIVQSEPTEDIKGSVRLKHKTRSGKIWYDTFIIPELPADEITIKYVDINTKNDIKSEKKEKMKSGQNDYIIPTLDNYKFVHYTVNDGKEISGKEGEIIYVDSNSREDNHDLIMYYKLIGDIAADLSIKASSDYITEGRTKDVEVTLNAKHSFSTYGIENYKFEASLSSRFYNSKVVETRDNKAVFIFKDVKPDTTIYGRVTVRDYEIAETATAENEIFIGKTNRPDEREELLLDSVFEVNTPLFKDKNNPIFKEGDFNFRDSSSFTRESFDFNNIDKWTLTFKTGGESRKYTFNGEDYTTVGQLNQDVNEELIRFANRNSDVIKNRLNSNHPRAFITIEQEVLGMRMTSTTFRKITIMPKTIKLYNHQYDVEDKKGSVISWISGSEIERLNEVRLLGTTEEEIDLERHMDKRGYFFTIPKHTGLHFIGWKGRAYSSGYWGYVSGLGYGLIKDDRIGISDIDVYSLYEAYLAKIKIECRNTDNNELIYSEESIVSVGEHIVKAPEYKSDPLKYAALRNYVLDSSRVSSPARVEIERNGDEALVTFYYIKGEEVNNDIRAIITTYPSSTYVGRPIEIRNNSFGIYTDYEWYINKGRVNNWSRDGKTLTKDISTNIEVGLKIWDDEGNESTDTKTISWNDINLDAKIGASPTNCIEGDIVNITNLSTGDYDRWEWKIGDNVKNWGKDGGTIIASSGATRASLRVWHSETGKSDTDSLTINATRPNIPPTAVIQGPNYVIRGETININDLSSDADGTIVDRQWNITGASSFISDLKTDGSGGSIIVDEFTKVTVHLTVTDNRGATASTSYQIEVGGGEEIDLHIIEGGTKKVNRKLSLDLSSSSVGQYYKIDWPSTKYSFIPISGAALNDIKCKTKEKGIDILSKREGVFDLKIDMKDTGGRVKSKNIRINVIPDIPPIVNNSVDNNLTFRTETIKFDSEMYSSDSDILKVEANTMYHDSDNDGDYGDEVPIGITQGNIKFDEVGMYKIVGFAKEEFGQETIEEFVTEDDRLEARVEITLKVDNMSPGAEIKTDIPPQMESVDLMVILDEDIDTGNKYKVHNLETGISDLTPIRDYLRGSITELVNKFKARQVDAKITIKDLKTDKYIKTVTSTKKGNYETTNDNNFPAIHSYDKEDFSGVIDRFGVGWTERRVDVTEGFTKTISKTSSSRNPSIFSGDYYVNEDRNILSSPSTKYASTANFRGSILRTGISWRTNYSTITRNITETKYKSNLSSKDESYFSRTMNYNSGGYSGTLNRTSVSWTSNYANQSQYRTKIVTINDLGSRDSKVFSQYANAPSVTIINGKNAYALDTRISLIDVDWTEKTIPGRSKTVTEIVSKWGCAYGYPSGLHPSTINYDKGGYRGTLYKVGQPYRYGKTKGPNEDREVRYRQEYSGTVRKTDVIKYDAKATYGGNVIFRYENSYNGTASYSGVVRKHVFKNYTGSATYSGDLTAYGVLDGYDGTATYKGTGTKLYREDMEPSWQVNSSKYILYVGDRGINNQDTLDSYRGKTDSKVLSIANRDISSAEVNISCTDIGENMDQAVEYIAKENPPIVKSAVLIGEEPFNILAEESDPEDDDIVLREIKYLHNPDYYLNSLGITSLPQNWQDAEGFDMNNLFLDKPGEYTISYRVQDEPRSNMGFEEYKKYSGEAQVSIFGHRRPIVTDFDINFMYNPSSGKYEEPEFTVEAYDPDYYVPSTGEGRSDRGIIAYDFRWKFKGQPDTDYRFGLPESLDGGIYNIEVVARDIDYAWSLPFVIETELSSLALELDGELYPEREEFEIEYLGVPASEELKVINIETIHGHEVDLVEFALYDEGVEVGPRITLNNPSDIRSREKSKIIWEDIRNYKVPDRLPEGMYRAKIEARAGSVREDIQWDVKVHTPIDLEGYINGRSQGEDIVVVSDDTFKVRVDVSQYTEEVTVELPFDCMDSLRTKTYRAGETIKLEGDLGDMSFSKTLYLPPDSVDIETENQQAVFRAYAINHSKANPNMEIEIVDFKTIGVKLESLRITRIADYSWKSYFRRGDGSLRDLAIEGIKVEDMPVYHNDYEEGIKLGYKVYFKIDSVGLSEAEDEIEIEVKYYALDEDNKLYRADIYLEDDNSGEYKKLEESLYKDMAKNITIDRSFRDSHESFPDKSTYNTWGFDIFLPYTTKVVKEGEELDLIKDNTKKFKLLVVFDIVGHKATGARYDYSQREVLWSSGDGSIYGRSRPTNIDLLGKGRSRGEVFYYNLRKTLLDDLELNREW